MPPPYTSFAALAAEQTEGVDFRRESTSPTGASWLAMAVHGGRIEAATAELAAEIAGTRMAYYGFIGTKAADNSDLHITSSLVDYPDLLAMLPDARRIISVHGMTGTVGVAEVAIGGLDAELVAIVSTALSAAGFDVVAAPSEIAGDVPANICNRGLLRRGCQLELSRALRDSFSPDGDISGGSIFEAGQRSATFYEFAEALQNAQVMILDYESGFNRINISGPSPGLLATFGTDAASSWGAADTGQEWVENGAASAFSVSGGRGLHSLTAVNTSRYSTIATGHTSSDITVSVATDVLATGGSHFLSLVCRFVDSSNMYLARVEFTTAAAINLTLRKRVAGTESLIGSTFNSGLTHTANGRVMIRFRTFGTALKAKVWNIADPEPASWQKEETDSDLATGEGVGVRSILSSANSNSLPVTASWDDFQMLGRVQVQHSLDGSTWATISSGGNLPPPPAALDIDHYGFTVDVQNFYRSRLVDADLVTVLVEGDQESIVPVASEPPPPPLVTVEPESGGYRVSWTNPGGQAWDNNYVVAEVWRDDCTGSQRIAVIPDGLNGSYLDLAIPQLDPQPVPGPDCEVSSEPCDVTYRVRYQGYVSTFVELPDTIPADMILGWPGTAASIPSGWSRVTALDGFHPRGSSGTGAPIATGGTASHSHTTPGHTHPIASHNHGLGGSTGTSNSSTTSARFNGASQSQANQPHSHSRPSSVGTHGGGTSSSTSPGTSTANNDPPTRDVIWVSSDGAQANYAVGLLGYATEAVSGWTDDVASSGRFLKGAAAAGNGGGTSGSATHPHSVNSHTHNGITHDHSVGSTGLSNPLSSIEAGFGSSTPRWLPRHTHPMDVISNTTGSTDNVTGGTASAVNLEPPNRRLRVLGNTGGGTQTRIIGLYTGAVGDLDPLLTLCDGDNGTPDMRTFFARDQGSDSVNSTGGSSSHTHTTPSHAHNIGNHSHDTTTGTSNTGSFEAPSFGDLGDSPTTGHTHSSGNTGSASPNVTNNGSGTTNSVNHLPVYKEVHFVRLDGTISGGPLPVPELKVTEFASSTVPSLTYSDDMDRLSSFTDRMAVATDRSHDYPRLVTDSTPLDGGLHTVSTTLAGEDMNLTMAVEGLPAINRLEAMLSNDRVYWSPLGGTPGWYAPAGWTVKAPALDVKVVQVTMIRQPWPETADPEEFL